MALIERTPEFGFAPTETVGSSEPVIFAGLEARRSWDTYLQNLSAESALSPFRLKQIQDFWCSLERIDRKAAYPYALLADDGSFVMNWDRGRHHFEIEVSPEGRYGWFYMDRESTTRASEEDLPLRLLTSKMSSFLRRTLA